MPNLYHSISEFKRIRLRFYWSCTFFLLLLALLSLYEKNPSTLVVELMLAALFLLTAVVISGAKKQTERHWFERITLLLIMVIGVWTICEHDNVTYLMFIIPIQIHLVFNFKRANWVMLMFSLGVIYTTQKAYPLASTVQIIFTYAAGVCLVTIFALMNEYHKRFLRKTLNLDQHIQAYNEQQLEIDLNKEIPRADRQGSLLAYVTVRLNKGKKSNNKDLSEINRMAQKISFSLRLNDSLYLIKPYHFVIILSGGDEADMTEVFTQTKQHIKEFTHFCYLPELHFYNPEDDTESLLQNIKGALHVI